jgi:hypothetical protein
MRDGHTPFIFIENVYKRIGKKIVPRKRMGFVIKNQGPEGLELSQACFILINFISAPIPMGISFYTPPKA